MIVGLKTFKVKNRIRIEDPTPDFYKKAKAEGRIICASNILQPFKLRIPIWIEINELR